MATPRALIARTAVATVVLAAALTSPARAGGAHLLHGIARDPAGNAIGNVEVLVSPSSSPAPARTARTDAEGRYEVSGLAPGVYRIAGFKRGYLAFLGQVNTSLRGSLDLLLRPAPEPGSAEPSASWALRLPERSLLRDLGPAPVRDLGGTPEAPSGVAFNPVLRGQVDQLFALGEVLAKASDSASAVQGAETRVRLAGSLGERGRVWLAGSRERLDGEAGGPEPEASAAHKAAAVRLGLSYDPTRLTSLAVRGHYSAQDLSQTPAESWTHAPVRQAERSWGLGARWSRLIDSDSRLVARASFIDSDLDVPTGPEGSLRELPPARRFSNRALQAGATFETLAGDGHRVRVGLEARHLDLPLPRLRGETAARAGLFGEAGASLHLSASDAWSVSAPATVVYGLSVHERIGGAHRVVPRVGGIFSGQRIRLGLHFSYHVDPHGERDVASERAGPLGYDAEFEVPLPDGFTVKGSISYAPARYEAPEAETAAEASAPRPVFLSDGTAAAREATIAVEKQTGSTTAYVQFADGTADGWIGVLPALSAPATVMANTRIHYCTGRVGVRIAPSGTDVAAEYRRIEEDRALDDGSGSAREFVELRLSQDLARMQGSGAAWRLLLGARAALGGGGAGGHDEVGGGAAWIPEALSRQLSAGVSVAF